MKTLQVWKLLVPVILLAGHGHLGLVWLLKYLRNTVVTFLTVVTIVTVVSVVPVVTFFTVVTVVTVVIGFSAVTFLRWLNTVLRAVSGNTRDRACF